MVTKKYLPLIISFILAVAAFTRLWNIPGSLQFLGDQGRDAMIVANIFKKGDLVFIGPVTSIGNMYLGPLYYYFMVPFLMLSYPSPAGPAYAIAILGIITVGLMYYLGRKLVGETAALLAAGLMAISETVTQYSRFSWNPNPAPLVSLIMVYATYYAWKKNPWAWIIVALCFSILVQLHYLTLLSAAGAGLIWLVALKQKVTRQQLSLTPLMLFDSRHQWLNTTAFKNMLTGQEETFARESTTLPVKIAQTVKETHGRSLHFLFEISIGHQRTLNTALVLLFLGIFGTSTYKAYKTNKNHGLLVLASYLGTGIAGTALYEHSVFDHYIAYLFPVSFLIIGFCLAWLWEKHQIGKVFVLIFVVGFAVYNIPRLPLKNAGWTIFDMQRVSQSIYDRVKPGEKYNIVLLSGTGDIDGQNYRYFLHTTDRPPVLLEQRGEVETLFIINEDKKVPKVTDSPVYEIVVFPDKEPKEVYTIPGGPEITVLRKNEL
jgi:4-amino-4-deoxy-L-arabinose transferase-like glycosyltransferase